MEVEELVKRAKLGDKEPLLQLIMLRKQEYYKLAYIYVGNKEDALDALEDMIVIIYENILKLKRMRPLILGVKQYSLIAAKKY